MYVLKRDVKERRRECKIMNNANLCRYLVDSCTAWARLDVTSAWMRRASVECEES